MSAQVAADLRAAVDVLERDGWAQGGLSEDGRWCAVEAVQLVACRPGEAFRDGAALAAVYDVIGPVPSIADWNDAPDRTAVEVIATLRAAADRAEADQ